MTKLFKRAIVGALLISLLIPCSTSFADGKAISVEVNGKSLTLDVNPIVISGRTLVPIRAIFEALGAKVEWDEKTKTVIGFKGDKKVELTIDKKDALVNGESKTLEVPAAIVDSRTMVPLRFISESLGAKVEWDESTSTARISLTENSTLESSNDGLKGIFGPTFDYGFIDKWYCATKEVRPSLVTCNKVFKEQYFYIPLILGNYKVDKDSKADIEYDLKIIDPDGNKYLSYDNLIFNKEKINPKSLIKSSETAVVCFEKGDKFGKYKIQVEARDKISGEKYKDEKEIELDQYSPDNSIDSTDKLFDFVHSYYRDPYPEKLVTAFITYCKMNKNDCIFNAFFAESFSKNLYLEPYLQSELDKQNKSVLDASKEPINVINNYKSMHQGKIRPGEIIELGTPETVEGLQFLWGQFYASSSYKVLKDIVTCLNYEKYVPKFEKEKESKGTLSDEAELGLLYQAGEASMEQNITDNPLVKSYCQYILVDDDVSDTVKAEIKKILEK